MTSSEIGTCHLLLAITALPWVLACGVPGDLERLGCPPGERCELVPARFSRGVALPCVIDPVYELFADLGPGPTAVALGGRSFARVLDATGGTTRWSEELRPVPGTDSAVGARVGPGRFSLYGPDGTLWNYVSMPVMEVDRVQVTDGFACPEQSRALLRGHEVALADLRPQLLAADGTPLVDVAARLRTLSGVDRLRPLGASVTLQVDLAGTSRSVSVPVVGAIDDIVPLETVLDQLRAGLSLSALRTCFQGRAGDIAVLGLPVELLATRGSVEPAVLAPDAPPEPACIVLDGPPHASGEIDVRMAGVVRTFRVEDR